MAIVRAFTDIEQKDDGDKVLYLFLSEVQINKLLRIMRKNNLIQVIEKTKQTNKQEIDIGLEMQ